MAITPSELTTTQTKSSRFPLAWVIAAILLIVALYFTFNRWSVSDLISFFRFGAAPVAPSAAQPTIPDFSILESPAFKELRRFEALPLPVATSTRRDNPFAPF